MPKNVYVPDIGVLHVHLLSPIGAITQCALADVTALPCDMSGNYTAAHPGYFPTSEYESIYST